MATIVDTPSDEKPKQPTADLEPNLDDLITEAEDSVQQQVQAEASPSTVNDDVDDLPEKYRGKSIKDIVRMHQEAERLAGRHSGEVGELRRVIDTFIQAPTAAQTSAQSDDDEDSFFDDPKTAIARAIESHPAIQEAKKTSDDLRKSAALKRLQDAHPDMPAIIADPGFAEWVGASKIRSRLFHEADQQYDYDAANELLSNWKERKGAVDTARVTEKAAQKEAVKKASTGSATGNGGGVKKPILRRLDIIKLMKTDPDRYQRLQPEIMAAYAEGRVR